MDKNTLIARGMLGLSSLGLIGVFWKEVRLAAVGLVRALSISGDFNKNRG